MNILTQSELKRLLGYNEITGEFTWRVSRSNVKVGSVAGCKFTDQRGKQYIVIKINRKSYKAHRLVWMHVHGCWPRNEIDHENGNGCDNRLGNLRDVTHLEQHKNRRRPITNTSGTIGVCFHKQCNKWAAKIKVNKKQLHLGLFANKADAISARKTAEQKYEFHENHGSVRPL